MTPIKEAAKVFVEVFAGSLISYGMRNIAYGDAYNYVKELYGEEVSDTLLSSINRPKLESFAKKISSAVDDEIEKFVYA